MGKTVAASILLSLGVPAHNSDTVVHGLLAEGGRGAEPVLHRFPEARARAGGVDKKILGRLAFSDPSKRRALEDILHPLVVDSQRRFILRQARLGVKIVVLDIPLLFETGAECRMDYTITVTAPAFLQRRRVLARGMSEADFLARLASQMPDAEKRRRADFVVQTGLGLAYTRQQLQSVLRSVTGKDRP